jgi:hypothetical protein
VNLLEEHGERILRDQTQVAVLKLNRQGGKQTWVYEWKGVRGYGNTRRAAREDFEKNVRTMERDRR